MYCLAVMPGAGHVSPDKGIGFVLKTLVKGGASVSLLGPSSFFCSSLPLPSLKNTEGKSVYSHTLSSSSLSLLLSLPLPSSLPLSFLLQNPPVSLKRKHIEEAHEGGDAHRGKGSTQREEKHIRGSIQREESIKEREVE
jgi:hypothetical protein